MDNSKSGIYMPGIYGQEARRFFRQCVGDELYQKAVGGTGGIQYFVAARVFLSQSDWEKFCWIEQHGSLDGFF